MSVIKRIEALEALEKSQDMRAVVLYLGDRQHLPTKLAPDIVRVMNEHLRSIGRVPRLGLVLYTRGGDTLVPLRLVSLIREYCEEFFVYVPFRAHSAGTMICLGADQVFMSQLGELSPIDPSIDSPLNPVVEGHRVDVGIEDVIAYLDLARNQAKIRKQRLFIQVFTRLVDHIHPLALGRVNRGYLGIRSLAEALLKCRTADMLNPKSRQRFLDNLTTKLYFHARPITRSEASEIGMRFVAKPDSEVDRLLLQLHDVYRHDLLLESPFSPDAILAEQGAGNVVCEAAYVESRAVSHAFVFSGTITEMKQPPPNVPPGIDIPSAAVRWTLTSWQRTRPNGDKA